MDINKFIAIGRLTKDPELKLTQDGTGVCRFSIAVNRMKQEGEEEAKADFINCVAFRGTAKFISDYLKKGNRIAVEGAIRTGSYEKEDGTKVYTTDVVCQNIQNLTPREQGETAPQEANEEKLQEVFGDTLDISSDDLPF